MLSEKSGYFASISELKFTV